METDEIIELITNKVMAGLATQFACVAEKMAEVVKANQEMYDRHLASLESSRDFALRENAKLVELSKEMTSLMNGLRADHKEQMLGYKNELHSAKQIINEQQDKFFSLLECKLKIKK